MFEARSKKQEVRKLAWVKPAILILAGVGVVGQIACGDEVQQVEVKVCTTPPGGTYRHCN